MNDTVDKLDDEGKPIITFVNHASFILSYNKVNLITDPWLFGSAFNNGWELLCKSKLSIDDFDDITHIWFSHEHPDHFSVPVLKSIPEKIRKKITVLFHATRDHKVINFCKSLRFQAIEMEPNHSYKLAKGFRLTCNPYGILDSWFLAEVNDKKILNINDCPVRSQQQSHYVFKNKQDLDVLFTQFSYAGWFPDSEVRKSEATQQLKRIKIQAKVFKPRYIVPFASFIRFSHENNSYMNLEMNKVDEASEFIEKNTSAKSIVLYPGDKWIVGNDYDNSKSLERYAEDYNYSEKPLSKSSVISIEDLTKLANSFVPKINKKNSRLAIHFLYWFRFFKTAKVFLQDYNTPIFFDLLHGIREGTFDIKDADIITDSDSLAYIVENEWGTDTLAINARFRPSGGNTNNFFKALQISTFNNHEWSFPIEAIGFYWKWRSFLLTKLQEIIRGRYNIK